MTENLAADIEPPVRGAQWALTILGRVLISILVPLIAFAILWQGFLFLRQNDAPKVITGTIAVVWGVGGVALIYWVMNWFLARLPERIGSRILPYLFVGPAIAILIWFLALPTLRTLWISLFNSDSSVVRRARQLHLDLHRSGDARGLPQQPPVAGRRHVARGRAGPDHRGPRRPQSVRVAWPRRSSSCRWRSRSSARAIIWNFVYVYREAGQPQIGLLNAGVTALGGEPQAWTTLLQPWNNLFLIVIMVWLQVGFAMVLFSAAIKGIPAELTEAARVDGATERQVFFRVMIPSIRGTIITVSTTVIILTLKIFDVVIVMTGGQFGTGVIATEFYRQYFTNRNFGIGSAIAVILLVAVIPVMIYNLRRFRGQAGFR